MVIPCRYCTVRTVRCHVTCEHYKEFLKKNDERKKKSLTDNGIDYTLWKIKRRGGK